MKEKKIAVLVIYIIFSFSTDILINYLKEREYLTATFNSLLSSLFTILEFCCFSLFFYFSFNKSSLKAIILAIIGAFTIFSIISYLFQYNKHNSFDSIPVTFEAIFMMFLCIYYFFEQIRNPNSLFIYSTSEFWFVTGILIYLAGTFFMFTYSSNLTDEELKLYWPINNIFNALKNILFGIAIYIHGRKDRKANEKDLLDYQSILENP